MITFDNMNVQVVTASVSAGQTTATVSLFSCTSNRRKKALVGLLSLEAAGKVVIQIASGGSQLLPAIYFAAKGTLYLGEVIGEVTSNQGIEAVITLDSAAAGSGVGFQAGIKVVSEKVDLAGA